MPYDLGTTEINVPFNDKARKYVVVVPMILFFPSRAGRNRTLMISGRAL